MAIYHLSLKRISRSSGRSSVAASAYRARAKMLDKRTGLVHDYRNYNRGSLLAEMCVLPDGTSVDREELWNGVEMKNSNPAAVTAREVEVALPSELPLVSQVLLVSQYASSLASRYGVAADVAVHAPNPDGDERNVHAHVMLSYCAVSLNVDGTLLFGDKVKELDPICVRRTTGKNLAALERPCWESLCNEMLKEHGLDVAVDHRSYASRGLATIPGVHFGPASVGMVRSGRPSARVQDYQQEYLMQTVVNLVEYVKDHGVLSERMQTAVVNALDGDVVVENGVLVPDESAHTAFHFPDVEAVEKLKDAGLRPAVVYGAVDGDGGVTAVFKHAPADSAAKGRFMVVLDSILGFPVEPVRQAIPVNGVRILEATGSAVDLSQSVGVERGQ